ncbi:MAG: ribonuclease H [Gemmatimonadaceae bacterium]
MVTTLPLVAVYADESCLGNGREGENPGGAGVLIEYAQDGGALVRRDLWVAAAATTNNKMALRSVIETFRALSRKGTTFRVVFTTDSRYIIDGMTKWVHDWARRGWRRKTGTIENLDLWRAAVDAAAPHDVEWRWVRGHNNHAQNEYANDLAVHAAETRTASGGLIASAFDDWLAKRDPQLVPDEFPKMAKFRAAPRLPGAEGVRP